MFQEKKEPENKIKKKTQVEAETEKIGARNEVKIQISFQFRRNSINFGRIQLKSICRNFNSTIILEFRPNSIYRQLSSF
jgi:hypothetical protein